MSKLFLVIFPVLVLLLWSPAETHLGPLWAHLTEPLGSGEHAVVQAVNCSSEGCVPGFKGAVYARDGAKWSEYDLHRYQYARSSTPDLFRV